MDVLIIGNPLAGRGSSEKIIREFAREVERRGHRAETFVSAMPEDMGMRASQVDSGFDRIVVAGGDGSIHQVLNALPDPSQIPILHLPTGTANMMAEDLGLPRSIKELARLLDHGIVRRIDMGLVGRHRFILVAGAGVDGLVTKEIEETRGKAYGYGDYVGPFCRVLYRHRPLELTVRVDDGEPVTGTNVIVLNVRHWGGCFVFSEEARLDSGRFEVCVFHSHARFAPLRYCAAGFLGLASRLRDVTRLSGRHIRIDGAQPTPVELDGDYFGTTPLDIELVPAAVPVIAPADWP
ncbi:MAG: diacylglycerol kinase family lipid kinase [Desulfomonile tiedjei]|nr:diacylglycerol kinase family lipid kinase [Desulfomonile tiedjei]